MDPNETLRLLRATAAQVHAEDGPVSAGVRASLVQHARDLAEYAEALDTWLSRGGFIPAAWDSSPDQGLTLTIDTGGDAFRQEDGILDRSEVARLLHLAADRLQQDDEGVLRDLNGNTCGSWILREEA